MLALFISSPHYFLQIRFQFFSYTIVDSKVGNFSAGNMKKGFYTSWVVEEQKCKKWDDEEIVFSFDWTLFCNCTKFAQAGPIFHVW